MNATTTEGNIQQVINENLQNINESVSTPATAVTRAERRRQAKAADKAAKKERKANRNPGKSKADLKTPEMTAEQQKALLETMESIKNGMVGKTWRKLEVGRHFGQDSKISFITDDTLVVGVDVASDKHDMRAFTNRGIEVSDKAFEFANSRDGFEKAYGWILELMARNNMKQAVIGLEPTGHYWFNLYWWMTEHKVTVLLVNPFAVNRIKEVDDNHQSKTDQKDPKTIASLIKDGRFSVPYLPDGDYADLRGYAQLRDLAIEGLVQAKNRLHRWAAIYFPAYEGLYDKIDAEGGILLLSKGIVPEDIVTMGVDGIVSVWKEAKLRGQGKAKALKIYEAARDDIHYAHGLEPARVEVRWLAEDLEKYHKRLVQAEAKMEEYCHKVAKTESIEAIPGITVRTLAPVLADLGDIRRFDNDEEIAKLSGLIPYVQESGKYKGQAKISRRGRKRIRKNLYKMGLCVIANSEEFKALHEYYTTRENNPLKKMQSLMIIMRKLLRIIRKLLLTGEAYDPSRILSQIERNKARPAQKAPAVA